MSDSNARMPFTRMARVLAATALGAAGLTSTALAFDQPDQDDLAIPSSVPTLRRGRKYERAIRLGLTYRMTR